MLGWLRQPGRSGLERTPRKILDQNQLIQNITIQNSKLRIARAQ